MGFKIGKFFGGIAKSVVRAVPGALTGFLAGGPAGALLGGVTSLAAGRGSQPQPLGGSQNLFSGVQALTTFRQPSSSPLPGLPMQLPRAMAVDLPSTQVLTREIFDIIVKLADRLGIPIKSPGSVIRIGRNVLAKLLRFARANPGLTIVGLLLNLGLSGLEANSLITWFTTHGKKRRRIKVTNVKALNRSVRRLEGFRRLSQRVELALARRTSARVSARTRRCPRCRKSPCQC